MSIRGIYARTAIHGKRDWNLVVEMPIGSGLDAHILSSGTQLCSLCPGGEYSLGTKHGKRFIKSHEVVVVDIDNIRHLLIRSRENVLYVYILRGHSVERIVLSD